MDNTDLNKARREIARLVKTEEEANDLVKLLLDTDWQQVYMSDIIPCRICKKPLQYHEVVRQPNGSGRFCKTCYDISVEKVCYGCKRTFKGHRDSESWCIQCRTAPCAICDQVITWTYHNLYKMCRACRSTYNISPEMMDKELRKLSAHLGRTRKNNVTSNLTLEQWFRTLVDFNWQCAYCLVHPYTNIDHFVPVCKNGETATTNCVPACKECNDLKHRLHPDDVTAIPQRALARVSRYLQTR